MRLSWKRPDQTKGLFHRSDLSNLKGSKYRFFTSPLHKSHGKAYTTRLTRPKPPYRQNPLYSRCSSPGQKKRRWETRSETGRGCFIEVRNLHRCLGNTGPQLLVPTTEMAHPRLFREHSGFSQHGLRHLSREQACDDDVQEQHVNFVWRRSWRKVCVALLYRAEVVTS
jgi:hypothetical protein